MIETSERPRGGEAVVDPDVDLRVGSDTRPVSLASALTILMRKGGYATISVIGERQVNIALKSAAIARGFLAPQNWDLTVTPAFFTQPNRDRPGEELTGLRLIVRRVNA